MSWMVFAGFAAVGGFTGMWIVAAAKVGVHS